LTYNSEKTTNNFNDETAGAETIDLPSGAGTATFTLVNNSGAAAPEVIVFTTTGSGTEAETPLNEEGITIQTVATAGVANVAILRIEDEAEDNAGGNVYTINLSYDSTDEDINIGAPVATTGSFFASGKAFDDSNDDDEWYVTNWSTTILYDQEDDDSLVITYPDEYSYGLAFVSPTAAVATTSGGVETVEMVPIQVGSAKLDTEIADATAQNLIVVGGPCANSVAATLMGNPADCAAGFVPGEAMIKLFEQTNGKVAVLVAGYSALDTRRASRVLANYKDYTGLAGASVTVKGTTLTDITVTAA
jgi:S-layer protein (TIGR01564 family)